MGRTETEDARAIAMQLEMTAADHVHSRDDLEIVAVGEADAVEGAIQNMRVCGDVG